jgi:DNA-directed RNA polymerase subunit RPC12/RpoP
MAEFGRLYTCAKCKEKVPNHYIRYDQTGKDIICLSCYNKQHPGKIEQKPSLKKNLPNLPKKQKPEKKQEEPYIYYICNSCKYKFKIRRGSKKAKRCPYCGKFDLRNLMEETFTADDLIKMALEDK